MYRRRHSRWRLKSEDGGEMGKCWKRTCDLPSPLYTEREREEQRESTTNFSIYHSTKTPFILGSLKSPFPGPFFLQLLPLFGGIQARPEDVIQSRICVWSIPLPWSFFRCMRHCVWLLESKRPRLSKGDRQESHMSSLTTYFVSPDEYGPPVSSALWIPHCGTAG